MGLKLSHMPTLRERISVELGVSLPAAALIKCKNAEEVCSLLQ
jgi:hypothetical protein